MRLLNLSELERLRGLPRLTSDAQRGEYLQGLKESIAGGLLSTPMILLLKVIWSGSKEVRNSCRLGFRCKLSL